MVPLEKKAKGLPNGASASAVIATALEVLLKAPVVESYVSMPLWACTTGPPAANWKFTRLPAQHAEWEKASSAIAKLTRAQQ
jgi:hypothetical protein